MTVDIALAPDRTAQQEATIAHLQELATQRPLTALSLGAGVQSTTIALLIAEGALPPVDFAVFADTGWEPARVYAHLDRLEKAVPFPILRVQEGNLRHEMLSPDSRFAAIPYFTKREPGPCQPCEETGRVPDEDAIADHVARYDEPVPDPLPQELTKRCPRCKGSKWDDGKGIGRRQCTSEYKLTPIRRVIRRILGAQAPDYMRVPKGRLVHQLIGFSTDEVSRANRRKDSDGVQYLTTSYPLLDIGMSRNDCDRWLLERGWQTEKSACVGCPFHGNAHWRAIRDEHPEEFADAVDFDRRIRKGGARGETLDGEAFLHRQLVPLDEANLEKITRREWKDAQVDIFDAVADEELAQRLAARDAEEAEEGRVIACSPFGCDDGEEEP